MKRPLSPDGSLWHHGVHDGKSVVQYVQDVEPILERNKGLARQNDGYNASRDMQHAASIPFVVVEMWRNDLGVDIFDPNHAEKVKRLLNDPDWRWLRRSEGRV